MNLSVKKNVLYLVVVSILGISCINDAPNEAKTMSPSVDTSISKISDTIPSISLVDNYLINNPNTTIYKKPYDMIYLWGSIKVIGLNKQILSQNSDVSYSFSLTSTVEPSPKNVLLFQVMNNTTNFSRTFILDSLMEESEVTNGDEYLEGMSEGTQMKVWSAYRFEKSTKTRAIIKVKTHIVFHSKGSELFMIQIAEPFKNIFTYYP